MKNVFEEGLLRYLTEDQLCKIQNKTIGIAGAGGLGSNAAMILVRSGFKNFEIIDKDIIDASNLNRQQYFLNEIDQPKVEVTKQRLLDINPDLNITIHQKLWTPQEGDHFFKNCSILVEAFDQASWKHKIVDHYQEKIDFIVSGNGMAGLLEKKPLERKRMGNVFFIGDFTTDSACGHPPMAPRVTACAAMMAEVILDITLDNI